MAEIKKRTVTRARTGRSGQATRKPRVAARPVRRKRPAISAENIPQLEAVIIEEGRSAEPGHIIFMQRTGVVLNRAFSVTTATVLSLSLMLGGMTTFAEGLKFSDVQNNVGAELDLATVIANIINVLLGLLGVVFVLFVIYGGFLWMTDKGDEKQAEHAKAVLKNSTIGVVIVALAMAISNFVISTLATKVFTGE